MRAKVSLRYHTSARLPSLADPDDYRVLEALRLARICFKLLNRRRLSALSLASSFSSLSFSSTSPSPERYSNRPHRCISPISDSQNRLSSASLGQRAFGAWTTAGEGGSEGHRIDQFRHPSGIDLCLINLILTELHALWLLLRANEMISDDLRLLDSDFFRN